MTGEDDTTFNWRLETMLPHTLVEILDTLRFARRSLLNFIIRTDSIRDRMVLKCQLGFRHV